MDQRTKELQRPSTDYILGSYIDPRDDIENERKKATFDPKEMTNLLYGERVAEKRRKFAKIVSSLPEIKREDMVFMDGVELHRHSFKQFLAFRKISKDLQLSPIDQFLLKQEFGESPFPPDLHSSMFTNAFQSQASDEQKEIWLPKILNEEIFGTYAQTELGHGTFLRGLETTATFDPERDEFILHSPTETSIKWWPGGLGRTSTHCILYARLFIKGKDYGPHAFLVQLRSMESHLPLPGISLGDIGPKMGWVTIDNGFLKLDHVRIPRSQMLNKYARVTKEGEYVPPPHVKFNYTTMIFVRTSFVQASFGSLAKAVTIAIRYSCVRRQGGNEPGKPEKQILDFKSQQQVLFLNLATAYALHSTGKFMVNFFKQFAFRNDDQDFSVLPELHATSAGLKALTTELAAEGVENCRRYCGGHGFHRFSGLPDLLNDHLPQVTGEGANPVLYLQTARYLVRQVENLINGKPVPSTLSYLSNRIGKGMGLLAEKCEAKSPEDLLLPSVQLNSFSHRAARMIFEAAISVLELQKTHSFEDSIQFASPRLLLAAKAHCSCFLLSCLIKTVETTSNPHLKKALQDLLNLFALGTIERELGDFMVDGFLNQQQARWISHQTDQLLAVIRPNAVAFVDSFDYSDFSLNSSLGRYDGDVYRDMHRRAQKEPRNQTLLGPAYEDFIKPYLKKSLL